MRRTRSNPAATLEFSAAEISRNYFRPPLRDPRRVRQFRAAVRGVRSGAEAIEVLVSRGMIREAWVTAPPAANISTFRLYKTYTRGVEVRAGEVAAILADERGLLTALRLLDESDQRSTMWGPVRAGLASWFEEDRWLIVGSRGALTRDRSTIHYGYNSACWTAMTAVRIAMYQNGIAGSTRLGTYSHDFDVAWRTLAAVGAVWPDDGNGEIPRGLVGKKVRADDNVFAPLVSIYGLGYGPWFHDVMGLRVPTPAIGEGREA